MALPAVVDSLEKVSENDRQHYKQIEDKFVIDLPDLELHPQVRGLKGAYVADHERNKTLSADLAKFKDVDPDRWAVLKDLSDEDLTLLSATKTEQARKAMVGKDIPDFETEFQKRVAPMKTAHQHEIEKRELALRAAEAKQASLEDQMRRNLIQTALTAACAEVGVVSGAVEDVVLYGQRHFNINPNNEVTVVDANGIEVFGADGKPMRPREWIISRGPEKAHWFPLNTGGGAGGGRFNGDIRIAKKSDLRDIRMKVDFITKHGGDAFAALPD